MDSIWCLICHRLTNLAPALGCWMLWVIVVATNLAPRWGADGVRYRGVTNLAPALGCWMLWVIVVARNLAPRWCADGVRKPCISTAMCSPPTIHFHGSIPRMLRGHLSGFMQNCQSETWPKCCDRRDSALLVKNTQQRRLLNRLLWFKPSEGWLVPLKISQPVLIFRELVTGILCTSGWAKQYSLMNSSQPGQYSAPKKIFSFLSFKNWYESDNFRFPAFGCHFFIQN